MPIITILLFLDSGYWAWAFVERTEIFIRTFTWKICDWKCWDKNTKYVPYGISKQIIFPPYRIVLPSYFCLLYYPACIQSCLIQSYPVLSCLVLSCLVLSCPVLSYFILSSGILSCPSCSLSISYCLILEILLTSILSLSLCLSVCMFVSLSHTLSLSLTLCLSLSLSLCQFLSLYLLLLLSLSHFSFSSMYLSNL